MKKKILVVYGNEEIEAKYKKAIEQLGFQHISFFRDSAPYKEFRPTLIDRAYNIFRRLFFNDKLALHRAYDRDRDRQNVKKMKEIAKKHPNIDKVLMFRADIFPKKMIKLCRKISKNMITHQFDGMKVCQKLMTFYKSFDRIFVFDKKDLEDYKGYGFMPLTNSWFPDEDYNINEIKQDLFYVGVGTPDRIEKITRLNEKIQQTQYSLNAYLSVSHAGLERQWGGGTTRC
ncbi:MAG: hypothetical protein Q4C75_03345 [Bergeyella zoohelcum]|nr:hypothetical protein [Bergeyella zoohelcum]